MIPESVQKEIEDRLNSPIKSAQRVSGGSINKAARIEIADIGPCFLKWNRSAESDMFAKEVHGLQLLQSAGSGLQIPKSVLEGHTADKIGFLVLEFIREGSAHDDSAREFGHKLARLHSVRNSRFGLNEDNYIGRLPQSNTPHHEWVDFFIAERMEPQLSMAINTGKLESSAKRSFKNMYKKLPEIFPKEEPSLLHGDLWGGNYFYDESGQPVIYDPAVYYGHREIELAFTYLFGGFSPDFYSAYSVSLPLESGFQERKNIYNLYPLLVHTNLFGGSYARQVESIVKRFG